jgi:large repetitive protein
MMKRFAMLALLAVWLALPAMAQTTTGSYTITIAPAPMTLTPPNGALAAGTVGNPYSASVAIAGGIAPYTAAVSSGALPSGITIAISGSSLNFSGTPTAPGTSSFVITVASSGSTATIRMKVAMQVAKNEKPKTAR